MNTLYGQPLCGGEWAVKATLGAGGGELLEFDQLEI
jgi:hypothetical protein